MTITKKNEPTPISAGPKTIPLDDGKFAWVDAADYERLMKFHWHIKWSHSRPYAVRKTSHRGRTVWIRMHRQVMMAMTHNDVHHKNHNTLDNRHTNLLECHPLTHRMIHMSRVSKDQ